MYKSKHRIKWYKKAGSMITPNVYQTQIMAPKDTKVAEIPKLI
jgi:hypothetical protein